MQDPRTLCEGRLCVGMRIAACHASERVLGCCDGSHVCGRSRGGTNGGSPVRYVQLAHNVRHPESGNAAAAYMPKPAVKIGGGRVDGGALALVAVVAEHLRPQVVHGVEQRPASVGVAVATRTSSTSHG